MKELEPVTTQSFLMEEHALPELIVNKLYHFLSQHYHIADQQQFERIVIQPAQPGELNIMYGKNDDIAGFSRTCKQSLSVGNKQITAYVAFICINSAYKTYPTVKNMGLTHAINYKLANPEEELIYIALVNNPATFEFINQLSDTLYPKPFQALPEQISTVIAALKKENGWVATNSNSMVVNAPLIPVRNFNSNINYDGSELADFYLETNPDFMQGNSLLVYIPLHLANISFGLNKTDSDSPHQSRSYPPINTNINLGLEPY